jgi:hypothetical protein
VTNVIARAHQPFFLGEHGHEQQAALRLHAQARQGRRKFDDRSGTAAIVIGPIIDQVAITALLDTDMVVVGSKEDAGLSKYGIGARQQSHHVTQRNRLLQWIWYSYRYARPSRAFRQSIVPTDPFGRIDFDPRDAFWAARSFALLRIDQPARPGAVALCDTTVYRNEQGHAQFA